MKETEAEVTRQLGENGGVACHVLSGGWRETQQVMMKLVHGMTQGSIHGHGRKDKSKCIDYMA